MLNIFFSPGGFTSQPLLARASVDSSQRNPFSGRHHGLASHELDLVYLLGGFVDQLPAVETSSGEAMAKIWLKFVSGAGWPTEADPSKTLVLENGFANIMNVDEYDSEYRHGRKSLLGEIGWKSCLHCRELIQGIYSEE